ncbi:54S ribosomal protein L23, mitochondrial [Fulvia fulva]|uniref:Large ribosomal subunit protein uL23m n=1 Tax=Passalora fulva TaxID=5499 RepID=A0A9Q8USZ3_PASFU|nr:54S ribosomal protein L23, mitochondrial [Fulvia fulva]KAK4617887.1 54S ribosomal protein L23, mitochondrial [Fulvia fulva]KAK4618678.1 54S ribosomal protein L23, mitochondrial [Fulvia fulva]UJO21293.1 54S ribosomal protein L23, mitochondrial [Fulvia fulva]WPV17873.1 54S ribosomal protein L23, mitochondrial [Fulvia fulva]WPV33484.1 54S ribosomal protein L23, mitochondrial [Fulvia fulva]
MATALAKRLPSFRVGEKELYLPSATLTFHRSTNPYNARFRVPLTFSKLDLRDYLWHAYSVEILSVRSYVKQQRVRSGRPSDIRPAMRRWHRPRSQKFMTVELARPFVWPEEPTDFSEWNREEVEKSDKEQEEFGKNLSSTKDTNINKERRERMREQAKELLEGKTRWTPGVGRAQGTFVSRA